MVHTKNDIVTYLSNLKFVIIEEIIEAFDVNFLCGTKNLDKLREGLFDVYDVLLEDFEDCPNDSFSNISSKVEPFLELDLMNDFISLMESVCSIVEGRIEAFENCDDLIKFQCIARLNKFFFQYQKEFSIQMNRLCLSEIKQKNLEIARLKQERIQILSKLSNSFAHELRNPLTSIKGFIQLLETSTVKLPEERKFFDYINREIKELEIQVNQILFLSNKKNHEDYLMRPVSLNKLVLHVLKTFQPIITENQIQLEVKLPKTSVVNGREDQLKLAFYKLLQNAVDALLMKDEHRKLKMYLSTCENEVSFCVENNGPPIPSVIKNNIFDPFVSTKELGKGIGLSIAKQIVDKHNGAIYYKSEKGWTTFNIVFPIFAEIEEKS